VTRPSAFAERSARSYCATLSCLLAVLSLPACGDSRDAPDAPAPPATQYIGAVTDEALARLLALPLEDATAGPWAISSPSADAALSGSEPIVLSVQRAATAEHVSKRPARPRLAQSRCFGARVSRFLQPIAVAHAHGLPFNGRAFYFVVNDAVAGTRVRIFADRTSVTLDSAKAAELRGAAQPLTLSVITAVFEQNEVASGAGPFALGSTRFFVE